MSQKNPLNSFGEHNVERSIHSCDVVFNNSNKGEIKSIRFNTNDYSLNTNEFMCISKLYYFPYSEDIFYDLTYILKYTSSSVIKLLLTIIVKGSLIYEVFIEFNIKETSQVLYSDLNFLLWSLYYYTVWCLFCNDEDIQNLIGRSLQNVILNGGVL